MLTAVKKHLGDFAAIVVVFILAVGIAAYVLVNQDARPTFPLVEESPISIEAEFSDAQAVVPGQGQSVRVAGVQVGKIGTVELEDGLAVVTMDIEAQYEDLVREDASALLRPRTGLKDMFIELDPGSKSTPPLEEGDRISVENTAPDIDPDEVLSALDTDTRAYLKLLVSGAGKGLENNGDDLREVFKRLEPLHRDLAKVQGAFADRREELAQLIHNYGILTDELGRQDEDLVRLVTASNDVFETLASVDAEISQTVAQLPGTLRTTENTLVKVNDLGRVLGPTLDDLRPAFQALCSRADGTLCLEGANREILPLVREGTPIVRDEIRPFVRRAQPYVEDLRPTARNLAAAIPDLTTSFGELNRFFNMLAFNPAGAEEAGARNPTTGNSGDRNRGGETVESERRDEGYLYWLAWVANNTVSLHSTSDPEGPIRRVAVSLNCETVQVIVDAAASGGLLDELEKLGGGAAVDVITPLIVSLVPICPADGGLVLPDFPGPDLPGPLGARGEQGTGDDGGAAGEEGAGEADEEPPAPEFEGEGLEPEAESSGEEAPKAPLEVGGDDEDAAG